MKEQNKLEIYNAMPVSQAVVRNAIPAMAAMLMTLIYNLADTFFIGQTHNAFQLAAVSLASPVFLIFMSVGMIFGIGGTSAISHKLPVPLPCISLRRILTGISEARPCKKNIFFLYVVMCRCRNYYVLPVVALYG